MTNEEKSVKLDYDYTKSSTFGLLGLVVSLLLAIMTQKIPPPFVPIANNSLILFTLCFLGSEIAFLTNYIKLKKMYKFRRDNKRMKKIMKFLHKYFWTIGLSLLVVGATKVWVNPLGIFISGLILFFTAVILGELTD